MATSGSTDFVASRAQIIRFAALHLNAISAGVTMGAEMEQDFVFALNAMVKAWASQDIHVWTTTEATLFPQPGQVRYDLSSNSEDHATEEYDQTTLSAAASSAATVLTVTSSSGMAAEDHVGIIVDDGTIHWSTIASVDSATQITIDDGLDDDAASGNAVFAYTTKIPRPLRIENPRRHLISSARDTLLGQPMGRTDYMALPDKTGTGAINQVFYDRQLTAGYLHIWRAPARITNLVKFTYDRPIEDFDNTTDNPDLPPEWIPALHWNLALEMTAQYSVPATRYSMIEKNAARWLDAAMASDRFQASVYFQPGRQ